MPGKIVFESPSLVLAGDSRAILRTANKPARESAHTSALPVIVGCPRSGTSLLAVMLDSHPQVAVPPETAFIGSVATLQGSDEVVRQAFFDVVERDRRLGGDERGRSRAEQQ